MSTQAGAISRTFDSATDLSAKQYFIVKISAAKTVALASAATDAIAGTIQNVPVSSGLVEVAIAGGTAKVVAGGSISAGDYLTTDGNGKAVATTTDGDQVIGVAVEAGDASDVVEYIVARSRFYAA